MEKPSFYEGRNVSESTPGPSAEDVRAQLQRILESPILANSARRRKLLTYVVEETLAGRSDTLKGYSVAQAVFDRGDDFDPAADPVVRLEAGRLRHSLDSYYVNAGAQDIVRISVPKGAYVAHFAPLQGIEAADPVAPDLPDSDPPMTGPPARPHPNRWLVALAGVACVAAVALYLLRFTDRDPQVADMHGPAIIVLPFEPLDGSDETRLFASSVSLDLISDLMRFPDLRLYSAAASFGQQDSADPQQLGNDLGVSYVIGGSVQSENGQLRLSALLTDASTGQVVWSRHFDRELSSGDLIGLQSELSSDVATALGEPYGVVNDEMARRLLGDTSPGMASFACVMRANEFRRTYEDVLFEPAMTCLENAIETDPDYADAWAMLGWLHLDAVRQDLAPVADHAAHLVAASDAGARAMEIDPRNQRGLEALAATAFFNGDFREAERLQRAALDLNPHNPELLAQLGWRLAVRGNWDEGIPLLETAIDRSANPPGWYYHMISAHAYLVGDYAAALAAAERSAQHGSAIGLSLSAISRAKLGDADGAAEDLAQMAKAWPLLASDPAAAYANFQVESSIVTALIDGLTEAGWTASAAAPE